MTLLQTLKWPAPAASPLKLPASGDSRRNALSPEAFKQQLSSGDWVNIGYSLKWFTSTSDGAIQHQSLDQWTPEMCVWLYEAYSEYLAWYLSNMTSDLQHSPSKPPPNLTDTTVQTISAYTACSERDAAAIYVDYTGHALAVEQLGILPWSLHSYGTYPLNHLFDASNLFSTPGTNPGQYMLRSAVPCAAYFAAKFVQENSVLCGTMMETIGQLIRWCKCLRHSEIPAGVKDIYSNNDFQWSQDFYGYRGAPPVVAMLRGSIYSGTDLGYKAAFPGVNHWTRGCHSTAVLIQSVMRAVNIPVLCIDDNNPTWMSLRGPNTVNAGEHASCYFSHLQRVLTHGDNPYELTGQYRDILPFPPEALTVHASEFLPLALLPLELDSDIIDRPINLLAAKFLTKNLVLDHYYARKAGQPAGSMIPTFKAFGSDAYTTHWWEARAIGTGAFLDALVEPYLGDADDRRLKAHLNSIPSW